MNRLTAYLLGIFLVPLASQALAEGKDTLWEISFRMEMADMPPEMKGMKLPGFGGVQKQTICLAEGKKYESEKQKDCKLIDQSQSGRMSRMTIQCKDGTMKIEREEVNKDYWRAKMEMTSSRMGDGAMTMFEEGKRLGKCDAEKEGNMSRETQQMLGDMKGQTDALAADLARQCQKVVWPAPADPFAGYEQIAKARKDALAKAKGNKEALRIVDSTQPDVPACAKARADYCAKSKSTLGEMGSRKAYSEVLQRGGRGEVAAAMNYCGVALAPLTAKYCKAAVSEADYRFVAGYCPAERKLLAKQHCAGRSYTAIEPKYQALCGGGDGGDGGGGGDSAGAEGAEGSGSAAGVAGTVKNVKEAGTEAVEQGVKKLRGMFGF